LTAKNPNQRKEVETKTPEELISGVLEKERAIARAHQRIAFWNAKGSTVQIYDSSISDFAMEFGPVVINVNGLKPGFYNYLDLKQIITFISGIQFSLILNESSINNWSPEFLARAIFQKIGNPKDDDFA
jgi:hypothetical protein